MILKNAKIVDDSFHLADVDIALDGDKITEIAPNLSGKDEFDLAGCTIVPGFVDIHIHACVGSDTCDADADGLAKMCAHLVTQGVTSFCPTTMTVSLDVIAKSIAAGTIDHQVRLITNRRSKSRGGRHHHGDDKRQIAHVQLAGGCQRERKHERRRRVICNQLSDHERDEVNQA